MTQRQIEVWLFHPRGGGPFDQARQLIESECNARGWLLTSRPTHTVRTPEGRQIASIRNEDVLNLYKRMHRARVGVWQIGKAHAPIKPRPKISVNDYVELRHFITHKAFHRKVSIQSFHSQWRSSLTDFHTWLKNILCAGEGDPRCLPFHVFRTNFKVSDLATQAGRSQFAKTHGPQSSRVDQNQLRWTRPKGPHHGREALQVAGRDLAPGFHWDVSSGTGGQRITTISDVWEIARNGYVNVYPDQHIREGKLAKRITPTKKTKAR